MRQIWIGLIGILVCTEVLAWQGLNMETGAVIDVNISGNIYEREGNIEYFDYELGELKLGYLSMFSRELGVIVDLDSGDLIPVQMSEVNQPK